MGRAIAPRSVAGYDGWQQYGASEGKELRKLDPAIPVTTALGVLGMPGLTAYVGLMMTHLQDHGSNDRTVRFAEQ